MDLLTISIPVSAGELLDKITILEIKAEKIDEHEKLSNVRRELSQLVAAAQRQVFDAAGLVDLKIRLKQVNEQLWDIEDEVRSYEHTAEFDDRFIDLARSVYTFNDERAHLKRRINQLLNSELVEEKSYGF